MSHNYFELLKKSDPSALEKIHIRYSRSIFWVGKQIIDDDFVVDTLVQDSFLKLWTYRDRIESPKHIYFFLRLVMKRSCYSYYVMPKTKFYRNINRLEYYDNYQEYMHGYDPREEDEHKINQEASQKTFDQIKSLLPLLNSERKRLIELCLKYGFQYKPISLAMGTSITESSNQVKRAIEDIKSIIHQGETLKFQQERTTENGAEVMTAQQQTILELRYQEKQSFASIARALNLSHKEVHKEFMTAYKLMREKKQQEELQKT